MNNEDSKKSMKGNKDSGIVMDVNGDLQNFDTQHNSGGGGIVVMKGGKPELYGQASNTPRGVPTKEELDTQNKAIADDDPIQTTTRVTMLPDDLDFSSEEVVIEQPKPVLKAGPKQVTRIDVSVADKIPEVVAKKRGRPKKS